MQNYVSMPRSAGQTDGLPEEMAQMDIAERRASQDGKIRRRLKARRWSFTVQQLLEIWGKNGDALPQQQCRYAQPRCLDLQRESPPGLQVDHQ